MPVFACCGVRDGSWRRAASARQYPAAWEAAISPMLCPAMVFGTMPVSEVLRQARSGPKNTGLDYLRLAGRTPFRPNSSSISVSCRCAAGTRPRILRAAQFRLVQFPPPYPATAVPFPKRRRRVSRSGLPDLPGGHARAFSPAQKLRAVRQLIRDRTAAVRRGRCPRCSALVYPISFRRLVGLGDAKPTVDRAIAKAPEASRGRRADPPVFLRCRRGTAAGAAVPGYNFPPRHGRWFRRNRTIRPPIRDPSGISAMVPARWHPQPVFFKRNFHGRLEIWSGIMP